MLVQILGKRSAGLTAFQLAGASDQTTEADSGPHGTSFPGRLQLAEFGILLTLKVVLEHSPMKLVLGLTRYKALRMAGCTRGSL